MMEEIRSPLLFRLNFPSCSLRVRKVRLDCRQILPHNFNEILDAMIDAFVRIDQFTDFPQGGIADYTDYNGGARGEQ